MNIHNIYDYVTGDMNIHCYTRYVWIFMSTLRVTWLFMSTCDGWLNIHEHTWRYTNIHETRGIWIFMITRHGWHEYSWVQITGHMSTRHKVTWIFMRSTRHGWHEYSWVHVTGDMNIHDYTSLDVTWIFMSSVYVTGDMNIHEYTSRVTGIFMSSRHGWQWIIHE